MPSIKQLEAFWWASSCVNFVTAAQRLNISVSSLSKRISELEAQLGKQLFDRSGHRAALTEAGTRLLPAVVAVLNAVSELQRTIDSDQELVGHCRCGVGDLSSLTWLPGFIQQVNLKYPRLILEIQVDVGGRLERLLTEGNLDFAVIAGLSSQPALVATPAGSARFAWAAAPALVGHTKIGVSEALQRWPLVTLPSAAGTTRLLDDWLLRHKTVIGERIICNSWAAVSGMLRKGLGVGFLPEAWVQPLELEMIGKGKPLAPLYYAFQCRRGDTRPLISAMQDLVQQCVDFSASPLLFEARTT